MHQTGHIRRGGGGGGAELTTELSEEGMRSSPTAASAEAVANTSSSSSASASAAAAAAAASANAHSVNVSAPTERDEAVQQASDEGSVARRAQRLLREMSREDALAGLTVGVMAIPQSMAYALIATLPPKYGLYTALVPPVVYALFGGSRQLHVGPVSMVSLITAKAIKDTGAEAELAKAGVATLVAATAGAMQIAVGVAGLGGLVNFATLPIISGFTAGAAIVVIVTQLKYIFGISVAGGETSFHTLYNLLVAIQGGVNLYSLVLSAIFLFSLWFAKVQAAKYPKVAALKAAGPLFVVCFGTAVTTVFSLHSHGVKVIPQVPAGLPHLTDWGSVTTCAGSGLFESVQKVFQYAAAIAFISFMESIAVAKTLAVHHGYEVEAGQELVSLGLSNFAGSFFSAYAAAGAFSRSAVASGSGARTQAAAMISSAVLAATLLFLTPLFRNLPEGVLSAIVINAVWGLIKVSDLTRLMKLSYRDAGLWLVAFFGTLCSVTVGLLLSVACSALLVLWDTSKPVVERVLEGGHATTHPLVVVVAVKGTLHGACSGAVRQGFTALAAEEKVRRASLVGAGGGRCDVVVELSGVTAMDTTVMAALMEAARELKTKAAGPDARCCLTFCGARAEFRRMVWFFGWFGMNNCIHHFASTHLLHTPFSPSPPLATDGSLCRH